MDLDNLWSTGPSLLIPSTRTHRPVSTTTDGLSLVHPAPSSRPGGNGCATSELQPPRYPEGLEIWARWGLSHGQYVTWDKSLYHQRICKILG